MKKKKIYVAVALIMGALAVFNVKTVLEVNHDYDLVMASIDALSETSGDETGDGETGATIMEEKECHQKNGYWKMALVSAASGVEQVTITVTGEASAFGFTIKGSYTKGKKYPIVWERWDCIPTDANNCCLSDQQGIRLKG